MSTHKQSVSTGSPPMAITRSFDDKPTAVPVVAAEDGVVLVGNPEKRRVTGFPSWQVFQFNSELLVKLQTAYESNNLSKLRSLWDRAVRYSH